MQNLTSGFFNSIAGDRPYYAEQFSELFEGVFTDGVFENYDDETKHFEITPSQGLTVTVNAGKAWFDGIWIILSASEEVTLSAGDGIDPRYDAFIFEINKTYDQEDGSRTADIKLITGVPASNPVKPALVNTEEIKQYPIAWIYRPRQSTSIVASEIEWCVGTDECPWAANVVDVIPITESEIAGIIV